ncbi:MAG: hypothetical protein MUF31_12760 [Akkermansiaceae bacterium]|jgi:hypothetical protein|nr:hypothetical protein [Akkermansiaceae bacterium]
MRFSDSEYCCNWLKQFEPRDTLIAKSVIDSMWFVSAREVEVALWKNIESTISSESATKVAFYTVSNKEPGRYGSEHKIGYMLEHVMQFCTVPSSINPSEGELISGNYSHIILVEDILGSGGTLHDFCDAFLTPKLRSRISSKRLTFHISCFCAYEHAIEHALSASKALKYENFHSCIRLNKSHTYFSEVQVDFFHRTKKMTNRGFPPLGFRNTGCPVVFEYSCPNNTPALLHKDGPAYRALFPQKKVPAEARELFNAVNRTPIFNLLTQLGVSNLEKISNLNIRSKNDFANFTAYLKLCSRGISVSNFQKYLIHESDTISQTISRLVDLGLVTENGSVSQFGRDLLKRLSSSVEPKLDLALKPQKIYIPTKINRISRGDQ